MPDNKPPLPQTSRREFLRNTLVLTAGVAAATAATPALAVTEPEPTTAAPPPQGYHVTAHIAAYYRSAAL